MKGILAGFLMLGSYSSMAEEKIIDRHQSATGCQVSLSINSYITVSKKMEDLLRGKGYSIANSKVNGKYLSSNGLEHNGDVLFLNLGFEEGEKAFELYEKIRFGKFRDFISHPENVQEIIGDQDISVTNIDKLKQKLETLKAEKTSARGLAKRRGLNRQIRQLKRILKREDVYPLYEEVEFSGDLLEQLPVCKS